MPEGKKVLQAFFMLHCWPMKTEDAVLINCLKIFYKLIWHTLAAKFIELIYYFKL